MKKIATLVCMLLMLCGNAELAQAKQIAKHVVFIGMDGWGAYSLKKGAEMPNVRNLMANGAYTLEKRSVLPSSSACNWATMFMGADTEIHGYTQWNSQKPELPSRVISHYGMFPSVWGLLRDAQPKAEIGYFYEWDGMQYVAEMAAMSKQLNVPSSKKNPRACVDSAIVYIKAAKPNLVGVILDEPDDVGHTIGHDTPEYYAKLKELDAEVGRIIEAVKEAGMYDNTIFILSSDHGGMNKGHGGINMLEMQSPFIICGKGVKKMGAFSESMMQYDVASTIAYIFGLKQPQVWIGRPMKQVFK